MATSKKCKELLCLLFIGLLFTSAILLFGSNIYLGYKLVSFTNNFKFAPSECIGPIILLTLLACSHIAVTWLGVNGATKEHLPHIVWFMIVLILQIISEIGIGIWAMLLYKKVHLSSTDLMINSFEGFLKDKYDKSNWETLQNELQCCGVNNISDYTSPGSSKSISTACCNSTTCATLFQQGCKEPVINYVKKLLLDVGLISFGSALFLMLGVICFYYLHKAIKETPTAQQTNQKDKRQEENPLNKQYSRG